MILKDTDSTSEGSGNKNVGRARSKSPFVKKRSKSPFKPLSFEDSLGNSETSRTMDDEENWWSLNKSGIDDLSKRTHSLASTATLTSNESSSGNGSYRNVKWSPKETERRLKSPRSAPRHGFLLSGLSGARKIASPPLSNATGQVPESDRGIFKSKSKSNRGYNDMDGSKKDGLYYQPSKSSLFDSNQSVSPKKPRRIRSRSMKPLRRKSHGDTKTSSQRSGRTAFVAPSGTDKRSKSCEPKVRSKSCDQKATKTKTKASPRNRKKPLSVKSVGKPSSAKIAETEVTIMNTSLHESWPRAHQKENTTAERQRQRDRQIEKTKLVEKSKRKKQSSKAKKKETKEGKNKKTCNDINDVITFFEDMATHKAESEKSNPPPSRRLGQKSNSARCFKPRSQSPPGTRKAESEKSNPPPSRGLGQKSNSARCFKPRSQSLASSSVRNFSAHAPLSDEDIMDTSSNHYKQTVRASEPEAERVMLDVSELASLEIIRIGKDNSLKLDLFDLMKYLKQQHQQLHQKRSY